MLMKSFETFPDLPLIKFDQEGTLKALENGEIEDLRVSLQMPVDDIVEYGLEKGFLKDGLQSFPDPRKNYDIPIDILLLPQVIQRLNDEHSLVSAPYMLNSSAIITKLGYSAKVLSEGFNKKNIHPREAAFHGETLKHVLLSAKANNIINWFNTSWNQILKNNTPGRINHYILDGTKLHIPKHLVSKFQGAGTVKNNEGIYEYGYKVVWIQEVIDRKGVIRAMKFAPINEHDFPLGQELVESFDFEKDSVLIMDRGFFDGEWITSLKKERGIDVCVPLKKNSEVTQFAKAKAIYENKWEEHPFRSEQKVRILSEDDLDWKACQVFESGVLVNFIKKNGENEYIAFVDTRKGLNSKKILGTYDLRSEIEESHRQMKCFQGLEKLPSKKYVQVIFRVIMGTIAYNLFNLFLNSEECNSLEDFTLKTHRQKKREERNPEIIVYAETTFAVLKNLDFLKKILSFKQDVRDKLIRIFENLSTNYYSTA